MLLKAMVEDTYGFDRLLYQCSSVSLYTDHVLPWKQGGNQITEFIARSESATNPRNILFCEYTEYIQS